MLAWPCRHGIPSHKRGVDARAGRTSSDRPFLPHQKAEAGDRRQHEADGSTLGRHRSISSSQKDNENLSLYSQWQQSSCNVMTILFLGKGSRSLPVRRGGQLGEDAACDREHIIRCTCRQEEVKKKSGELTAC